MKLNLFKKQSKKIGLEPGAAVLVGEKKVDETKITLIDYAKDHFEMKKLDSIEEPFPTKIRKQ